ncbi:MAG: GntR family transcriptional regulator [Burkholderiales bacterium]|nr:GntR family transcriptional regulator [Burkholderiales bacterium]
MIKHSEAKVRKPRYVRLAQQLAEAIRKGTYGLGECLPPEVELCRIHGVSRHTVREALRQLDEMGLISRRRREGTTIRARSSRRRYTASISTMADLFQYVRKPRYRILSERLVSAGAKTAALLGCKRSERWLKFEACRYHAGVAEPISFTEFYVRPAYGDVGASLRKRNPLIYSFIERHVDERVIEIRQKVRATAVPPEAARLLRVKPLSPGLYVSRRFLVHGNRVIAGSVSIYPENRFEISLDWRVEWARD